MARYTGPRDKVSRRFGVALFGSTKALEKRPFPPGQHGMRAGRKKKSDYGVMLAEKQQLRFQYGVLEGQFRKYYADAARRRGITGDILLQLLELRLDNVVYRLGFANSRTQARQLVRHGVFTLNGHKVTIPSLQVKVGDSVEVPEKSRTIPVLAAAPDADSFFPNLADNPAWRLESESETFEENGLKFRYVDYVRK